MSQMSEADQAHNFVSGRQTLGRPREIRWGFYSHILEGVERSFQAFSPRWSGGSVTIKTFLVLAKLVLARPYHFCPYLMVKKQLWESRLSDLPVCIFLEATFGDSVTRQPCVFPFWYQVTSGHYDSCVMKDTGDYICNIGNDQCGYCEGLCECTSSSLEPMQSVRKYYIELSYNSRRRTHPFGHQVSKCKQRITMSENHW